jgi:hypothetical protein
MRTLQVPFNTMTRRRKPKVADWLTFLRTAIPYTFYQVGPSRPREAWKAMIDALNLVLDATADYDPDDEDDTSTRTCRAVRTALIRALFKLERDFPKTELSIAIHELVHVPDFLWRWNSVRNYWGFIVERLVGFMKKFVQNRSLAVENMVIYIRTSKIYNHIRIQGLRRNLRIFLTYILTWDFLKTYTFHVQVQSYARGLLVRAVDPLTRGALRERMQLLGSAVHLRSFLDAPTPPGHTVKGSGLVAFKANRYNSTNVPMDFALQTACERHMQSLGVQGSDYNYGVVSKLDAGALVTINGRRYKSTRKKS